MNDNSTLTLGPGAVKFFQDRLHAVRAENAKLREALLAARAYIEYTQQHYHHDTEQDELWRIWHDKVFIKKLNEGDE